MTHHPIRDCRIETFVGETGAIALIGDGKKQSFPLFRGRTEEEASGKAHAFKDQVIADHEAKFIRRKEAAALAESKRKARAA